MLREMAAAIGRSNSHSISGSEQSPTACFAKNVGRGRRESKEDKAARHCNHCKRSGHTSDQCFKLIGYPDWYNGTRDIGRGKALMRATANMVGQGFNDSSMEDIPQCKETQQLGQGDTCWVQAIVAQAMKKWMKNKPGPDYTNLPNSPLDNNEASAFAHFAGTSTNTHSGICCSVTDSNSRSWIVDTGASDHMTFNLALLTQLTTPCKPIFVTLPDGTSKPVQKIGQASLTPSLALHNVLHISDLKLNLHSVAKLSLKITYVSFSTLIYVFFRTLQLRELWLRHPSKVAYTN